MIWIISHLVHCNSSSSCELHMGGHSANPVLHLRTFITHIHCRDPSEDLDPGSENTWAVRLIRSENESDGSHRRSHQNTAHMHKHHHHHHLHHHPPPPPHACASTPAHKNTERRSPSHPLFRIMFYMTLERHQRLFLHLARTFSTQSKWLLHIRWFLKAGK